MDELVIKEGLVPVVLNRKDLTIVAESASDLPPYWDAETITAKLAAMPGGRDKMFCQFLWMTGTRVTEAINVRKRDVDLARFTCQIRWLKSRKYQTRMIALHYRLRDMLDVYMATLGLDELLFAFSRQRGYQVTLQYFGGNPHRFRHSFAIQWLRCGGELVALSRALGHSDIRHTMIYLRIVPLDVGKELQKVTF